MLYANLLLNVLYHIEIEMKIRESCLQTGNFIYKPGISLTKQDFHLQRGSLGLQRGFSGYYLPNDKKLNKLLYKIAKKMLLHRSGTEYEDMYWIDLINGKIVCKITDSKYKKKILYTTTIKKMIKKSENLLTIHTHPDSFPPSIDDINSNYDHNYEIGIVICHDGRVYMYSAEERINVNYYKLTVEDYLKNGYNEDTAQIEALKEMQKKFSIYFKEVTEDDCV